MLSEKSQRIITEHVDTVLPLVSEMRDAAKSGGPNQQVFIQSRCDQVAKLLKEIKEKV